MFSGPRKHVPPPAMQSVSVCQDSTAWGKDVPCVKRTVNKVKN